MPRRLVGRGPIPGAPRITRAHQARSGCLETVLPAAQMGQRSRAEPSSQGRGSGCRLQAGAPSFLLHPWGCSPRAGRLIPAWPQSGIKRAFSLQRGCPTGHASEPSRARNFKRAQHLRSRPDIERCAGAEAFPLWALASAKGTGCPAPPDPELWQFLRSRGEGCEETWSQEPENRPRS